jgi:hypothetical protein
MLALSIPRQFHSQYYLTVSWNVPQVAQSRKKHDSQNIQKAGNEPENKHTHAESDGGDNDKIIYSHEFIL